MQRFRFDDRLTIVYTYDAVDRRADVDEVLGQVLEGDLIAVVLDEGLEDVRGLLALLLGQTLLAVVAAVVVVVVSRRATVAAARTATAVLVAPPALPGSGDSRASQSGGGCDGGGAHCCLGRKYDLLG